MNQYSTNKVFFPDPKSASPDGLLAYGGDLSPQTLLTAYSTGIFPWYQEGSPILWWSPDPRMVLFPDQFKVSDSLNRLVKKDKFEVKFDQDFEGVIRNCASVSRDGDDETWITEDMIKAYCDLHLQGYAHSVESYYKGQLAGGLYGLSIGKAFFGESMYYHERDASKVAFYWLMQKVKKWEFYFVDAQVETGHLESLGAENISRERYLEILKKAVGEPSVTGNWNNID